jgi:23S rRNA-/tRNA-specific pseudouridylate synthase
MASFPNIRLLQAHGSPWLKSKVLFADHRAIVLNKPSNLVCQLRRIGDNDTVCLQAQPSVIASY